MSWDLVTENENYSAPRRGVSGQSSEKAGLMILLTVLYAHFLQILIICSSLLSLQYINSVVTDLGIGL